MSIRSVASITSMAVVCALMVGCSSERIILLEDEDGGYGAVEVRHQNQILVLERPLAAARVGGLGDVQVVPADAQEVNETFGAALSAMPAPPKRYVLYFEEGTTVPTADTRPVMARLLVEMDAQPVADIQVTGHTDRVGSIEDNDRLARDRAGFVRNMLREAGYEDRSIRAVGRGEREPLVVTEDEVREPRNRRVEVIVR